jgi:hypothetical protein
LHTTPPLALAEATRNHWRTHLLDTCGGEPRKNKSKKGTKNLAAAVTVTTRTSDPACNSGSRAARLGRDRRGVERRQPGSSRVALEGLWVYETIITKNAKVNIEDEERRCFGNEDEEPTEDVLNSKCCNIFLSFMISFQSRIKRK